MREVVPDRFRVDTRARHALALDEVREKPPDPISVAARLVRVMARPSARAQLLERRERIRAAVFVDDPAHRPPLPVRALQAVDEVDPQRVLGLAHLPVLADALAFQVLAEPADLVGDGFVGRRQ
jgi:hypothetical protein